MPNIAVDAIVDAATKSRFQRSPLLSYELESLSRDELMQTVLHLYDAVKDLADDFESKADELEAMRGKANVQTYELSIAQKLIDDIADTALNPPFNAEWYVNVRERLHDVWDAIDNAKLSGPF